MGRTSVVRTDNSTLKHLWDQRIHTVAQQRWLRKFLGFDFTIEYKQEVQNRVADALFRRDSIEESPCHKVEVEPVLVALSSPIPLWLEEIKEAYKSNAKVQELLQRFQNSKLCQHWALTNGILF